jgi:TM2 domain-containing membrane protein YozV
MANKARIRGETVWLLDTPQESSAPRLNSSPSAMRREAGKNPAVAFSLSLWVWGGGQMYNRQWQLGLLYFLFMVNFYLFPGVIIHYWTPIETGLATLDVTASEILAILGIFCITGLMIWVINAVQAYYGAAPDEVVPFEGVRNPLLSAVCSLLIPGWGQFLNGQTKKGVCFLIATMAGLFAVAVALAIPFLWPTLNTEMDRRFAEGALFVAWLLIPPILLVWGGSVYDAAKVCIDPLKKQPIRERIEAAVNRMRMNGWRGALSRLELTVMFSLYLVFSLALSRSYFPQDYYVTLLHDLRVRAAQQQMVIIPRRIDQLSRLMFPADSR